MCVCVYVCIIIQKFLPDSLEAHFINVDAQQVDKAPSINTFKQHTRVNSFETFRAKADLRQSEIKNSTVATASFIQNMSSC